VTIILTTAAINSQYLSPYDFRILRLQK